MLLLIWQQQRGWEGVVPDAAAVGGDGDTASVTADSACKGVTTGDSFPSNESSLILLQREHARKLGQFP